jgi:hypothetical protein
MKAFTRRVNLRRCIRRVKLDVSTSLVEMCLKSALPPGCGQESIRILGRLVLNQQSMGYEPRPFPLILLHSAEVAEQGGDASR